MLRGFEEIERTTPNVQVLERRLDLLIKVLYKINRFSAGLQTFAFIEPFQSR